MAKAPESTDRKPVAPKEALHWVGEPARVCANCDHFKQSKSAGICHNGISQRYKTTGKDLACLRGFYPDTKRWPLHMRLGIVPAPDFVQPFYPPAES